jgi:precorrin-6A/cobalt-precorrin-6A reductase
VPGERLLVLGGTAEARALAAALSGEGFDVVSSLAGVTSAPLLPEGEVRIGGFGGAGGLARYLREAAIALVCDATHPFAAKISRNAVDGARLAGVPCVRLERPAWTPQPDDQWTEVADLAAAAAVIAPGARVLLTTGRKELGPFRARGDIAVVARVIERPEPPPPPTWTVIAARPPFTFESERTLMLRERIDVVVTKNAGGRREKLDAAAALGIPVVMVRRPAKPPVPVAASVAEMTALIRAAL